MRHFLCAFLLIQLSTMISAQRPLFGADLHYGFIAPHNQQMVRLITGHSWGANVYCQWKTSGSEAWHLDYHQPSHRLDYIFVHTGNSRQLGTQHALTYQLHLPLGVNRNRQSLIFGLGPAYTSKKWDLETNTQAFALSSHFNAALVLQYQLTACHWRSHQLHLGLRVTHLSNGAFTMPNAGTNNIGVLIGWQLKGNESKVKVSLTDSIPKWQIGINAMGGLKEIQPPLSKKYPIVGMQAHVAYQLNCKSALMGQIDGMLNTSNAVIESKEKMHSSQQPHQIQMGFAVGYQARIGIINLFLQQGVYVYDPYGFDGLLYHRFGFRTNSKGPWYFQLALKTHFAKADHGEIGLGYTLMRKGHVKRGGQP